MSNLRGIFDLRLEESGAFRSLRFLFVSQTSLQEYTFGLRPQYSSSNAVFFFFFNETFMFVMRSDYIWPAVGGTKQEKDM